MREPTTSPDARFSGNPRRGRPAMLAMLALLLIVVLATAIILPKRRHAAAEGSASAALSLAQDYERRGLHRLAAEQFLLAAQGDADPARRNEAALRLADLREKQLNDSPGAELALEMAILAAPDESARTSAAARLLALRAASKSAKTSQPLIPPDQDGTTVAATVGNTKVTVEDIMFAWGQSYGPRPPDAAFGSFVQNYLNLVLLAEEADKRGISRRGRVALDLRMQRVVSLARGLSEMMIGALPDPSEKELRAFYDSTRDAWRPKRTAEVRHVAGIDPAAAPDFAVAPPVKIAEDQLEFPELGAQPGLAPILLSMNDGATTGPIRLAGGLHWFRVDAKSDAGEPAAFEAVRDQVLLRYQSTALEKNRQALLARLRRETPIEIHDPAFAPRSQAPTTQTAVQGATKPRP